MRTVSPLLWRTQASTPMSGMSSASPLCRHIHIGLGDHTPQTLRNLANIMASHESLLASALKLDKNRMDRYCRTVDPCFLMKLNEKKPRTMEELADVWYSGNGARQFAEHTLLGFFKSLIESFLLFVAE